jgi:glucose-1-phosphate cytidylyltransferase
MKVVILAGGLGSRLSEETTIKPKPMVEVGDYPILWHIMKTYSHYGYNEFVILLGYKGYYIKEYFSNYFLHNNDVTIDIANNSIEIHNNNAEPWKVTLLDTGAETMTGGRIKQAQKYTNGEPFFLTYGDGVCDVNIAALLQHHQNGKKMMTVTAIQPEGRFGVLEINEDNNVERFYEKPHGEGGWINGGYFVCEQQVFDYIPNNKSCIFEKEPMENLATNNQLLAYQHTGFWKCMDTLRDKVSLNELWNNNEAKWKIWK